jgi:hypothetical protein
MIYGKTNELRQYLQSLIDTDQLDGAARGITLQLIEGKRPLTDKQQFVFDRDVAEPFLYKTCSICGAEVESRDLDAYTEAHMCGDCNWSHISFMKHD